MEHLNNSISVGERSSTFLSSVPQTQPSRVPDGRAKSRPRNKQRHLQQQPLTSSALVVPVESLDSEG